MTKTPQEKVEERYIARRHADFDVIVSEIESFIEPQGTEEARYLRGKQAGLRLAAAIVRNYALLVCGDEP